MLARRFFSGLLIPLFLPFAVFAYASPGKPAGFVNDFAAILQDAQRLQLEAKIAEFEKSSGDEIAVVTVPSLGGDTIENFAVKLFEEWKVGKKGKDNGVLVLVAPNERQIRIEVGYGLEGALTDAQSSWIIQNVMRPAFRDNNFYLGIDGAVDKIISAVRGEVIPADAPAQSQNSGLGLFDWLTIIFLIPVWLASVLGRSKSWWAGGVVGGVIGAVLGFMQGFVWTGLVWLGVLIPFGLLFDFLVSRVYAGSLRRGQRPPWWIGGGGSGSSGGGGFGGFGGGSSGGGGASGSW